MLDLVKYANLALAFALELAMLAAFASWALRLDLGPWLGWGLAAAVVAVAVVVWGIWAAPNSATRLDPPALMTLKFVLFALATAGLWASGRPGLAIGFAVVAALNFGLAALWGQL